MKASVLIMMVPPDSSSFLCLKIHSLEDLKLHMNILLNDIKKIRLMKNNAYNFSQKQFFDVKILEETVNQNMNL